MEWNGICECINEGQNLNMTFRSDEKGTRDENSRDYV